MAWIRCTPLLLAGAYALALDLSHAPVPLEGGEDSPIRGWKREAPDRWAADPPGSGRAWLVGTTQGDLDGDGRADAVAILVVNAGGTGYFQELLAFTDRDGRAVPSGSAGLGDRCRLHRLAIDGGIASLLLTVHGDREPMCCPTRVESRGWRLSSGGELVPCWRYLIVEGFDGLLPATPAWWIGPPLR